MQLNVGTPREKKTPTQNHPKGTKKICGGESGINRPAQNCPEGSARIRGGERAVLPRGKVINRQVITKLWVNGRASEDREMNGQKRSEPIANAATTTMRKPLRYRQRGY